VTLKDSARVVDNTATVAGGGIYIVGAALNACTTRADHSSEPQAGPSMA
jgi:predicted outer membrane repeat protein